jgi:hypothetical protein
MHVSPDIFRLFFRLIDPKNTESLTIIHSRKEHLMPWTGHSYVLPFRGNQFIGKFCTKGKDPTGTSREPF